MVCNGPKSRTQEKRNRGPPQKLDDRGRGTSIAGDMDM